MFTRNIGSIRLPFQVPKFTYNRNSAYCSNRLAPKILQKLSYSKNNSSQDPPKNKLLQKYCQYKYQNMSALVWNFSWPLKHYYKNMNKVTVKPLQHQSSILVYITNQFVLWYTKEWRQNIILISNLSVKHLKKLKWQICTFVSTS